MNGYDFEMFQGGNDPIRIDAAVDLSACIDFHAGLYGSSGSELMHWSKDDVDINGSIAILRVSQEKSADLPEGTIYLECASVNSSGRKIPHERKKGYVHKRFDKHVLLEEALIDEYE
ncbi:MAG: hypothetical protein Q4B85_06705 [Lachnospiraceae bacterium]|nr:hypothetical protein [Lachnospiraceae bacterium]